MNKAHGKTLIIENNSNNSLVHAALGHNADYDGEVDSASQANNNDETYFATKVVDRVQCDICHKQVCNKYFLRTHKQKVHGIYDQQPHNSNFSHSFSSSSAANLHRNGNGSSAAYQNEDYDEENEFMLMQQHQQLYDEDNYEEDDDDNNNQEDNDDGEVKYSDRMTSGVGAGDNNSSHSNGELGELTTSRVRRLSSSAGSMASDGAVTVSSSLSNSGENNNKIANNLTQHSFCDLCKRKFYSYNFLRNHMKKIHQIRLPRVTGANGELETTTAAAPAAVAIKCVNDNKVEHPPPPTSINNISSSCSTHSVSMAKEKNNNNNSVNEGLASLLKLNKQLAVAAKDGHAVQQHEQLTSLLASLIGTSATALANTGAAAVSVTLPSTTIAAAKSEPDELSVSTASPSVANSGGIGTAAGSVMTCWFKCALCAKRFVNRIAFKKHLLLRHRLTYSAYMTKTSTEKKKNDGLEELPGKNCAKKEVKIEPGVVVESTSASAATAILSPQPASQQQQQESAAATSPQAAAAAQRKRKNSTSSYSAVSSASSSYSACSTSNSKKCKLDGESSASSAFDSSLTQMLSLMRKFYASEQHQRQLQALDSTEDDADHFEADEAASTNGHLVAEDESNMQAFILENEEDALQSGSCLMQPCVVYLPVKSKISGNLSLKIKLKPIGGSRDNLTGSQAMPEGGELMTIAKKKQQQQSVVIDDCSSPILIDQEEAENDEENEENDDLIVIGCNGDAVVNEQKLGSADRIGNGLANLRMHLQEKLKN